MDHPNPSESPTQSRVCWFLTLLKMKRQWLKRDKIHVFQMLCSQSKFFLEATVRDGSRLNCYWSPPRVPRRNQRFIFHLENMVLAPLGTKRSLKYELCTADSMPLGRKQFQSMWHILFFPILTFTGHSEVGQVKVWEGPHGRAIALPSFSSDNLIISQLGKPWFYAHLYAKAKQINEVDLCLYLFLHVYIFMIILMCSKL